MTPFKASEVYFMLYQEHVPITSIHRAMTNLASKRKIIKTGQMKKERYGKPNYIWKLI
jgi:hypothetical protein